MILVQNLHFFCLLTYAFMAIYILLKDPKALLNQTCALLIFSFSVWNFIDVFSVYENFSRDTVILFQNVTSIGWISFPGFLLCFSLVFSKNEKILMKKWFLVTVVALPLLFIFQQFSNSLTDSPVLGMYGWEFAWSETVWTYFYYIYYVSFSLISALLIYLYKVKTKYTIEKNQAKILVLTLLFCLIGGTITDVLLPLYHVKGVPQLGNIILLVFAGGMIYSILKYKFLLVTPAIAAENIISNMEEMLILTDKDGIILNVNNSVHNTLGFEKKDLEGKSIEILFCQDDFKAFLLKKISQDEAIKNHETIILNKDSKKVPISVSCSLLKDKEHEKRGIVFVARDISERKNAERVFFESQQVFKMLVENSPDIIARYDINCQRTYVNPEYLKTAQMAQQELISSSPQQCSPLPAESAIILQDLLKRVISTGIAEAVDLKWRKSDQQDYWYNVYAFPEFGQDGNVVSVMTNSRDITKSRNSEAEIARVNRALRMLSDFNQALIHISNETDLLKATCRIAVDVGGYRMAWVGYIEHDEARTLRPVTHAGYDSKYIENARISWGDNERGRGPGGTSIRTGQPCIVRNIQNDPTFKPWKEDAIKHGYNSIIALPLIIEGQSLGAIGIYSTEAAIFDIKEVEILKELTANLSFGIFSLRTLAHKNQVEKALSESEKKYRDLFENAGDAILIADVETGIIVDANNEAEVLLGRKRNEIIGINRSEIHPSDKFELYNEQFRNHIKAGLVKDMESEIVMKDGKLIPVSISAVVINLKGRKVIQGFFRDISERKQAESEIIKAKEKAEESDRLKSAFLANMSHEIRTPMNGILGFAGLLANPNLSGEKQQEYIRIIEYSGRRMLNIINDIVSISKIESGQMEISISKTDVNEQIEFLYKFFKPETDKKKILLFYDKSLLAKGLYLNTDKEKLYSILANLINNAIKFTNSGSIEFGYIIKDDCIEFFVKDTGVGIHSELHESIFERFRQGSEALTRNYEGSGLGLTISKAYVEMLGGKIWLKSETDKGSEFYFTLPFNVDSNEMIGTKANSPAFKEQSENIKINILIAEDDETNVLLIQILIKQYCKKVFLAKTGVEAVNICLNNPEIDLVLMDIKMPGMDGIEAIKKIREFNKNIIIIAQTAYALSGDREKTIKAGSNDYISKPFNEEKLHLLIERYFGR
ncbi:MAG: hypothetical protein A2W91_06645 [Bacteroidetes bacterium GWF2_38_335]|nr:MAG: hypothetical protein A2W91_06645 [Bacteroidetes bacterium GWF2_38_335]HBS89060.1 hypothetical protein [Bacteroidales bacterium]